MAINFKHRISLRRPYPSGKPPQGEEQISRYFESDRGRIIHSAALRRLQQKTQVFPLERNAAVRSRLTHSLEVQQTGRYIVREVLQRLKKQPGGLAAYGLEEFERGVESLVEMACLLHDVGNPPFGHFGEAAINDWFNAQLPEILPKIAIDEKAPRESLVHLYQTIRQDLSHFEGNAQGIRLVHTLLQLNLSYSQVACVLKYTAPAWWQEEIPEKYSVLMKKPGFYLSEQSYVDDLRKATGLEEFHRFPLTYMMEAADDISYCIADLDDAVEKAIFSVDSLYRYLEQAWAETAPHHDDERGETIFSRTVGEAWKEANASKRRSQSDQFFMSLRVNVQRVLVARAVERFLENLPAIFNGDFNQALLEDGSDAERLLKVFKRVARRYVFSHSDVEQLELQGYRVIQGLLDAYKSMMLLTAQQFTQLAENHELHGYPIETRLFHRLSDKHIKAYRNHMLSLKSLPDDEWQLWEGYYRLRLVQDYISGMTDLFAWEEYRRLMAVDFV